MSRQITKALAERALVAVKVQFKEYLEVAASEPKLYEPGYHARSWTIAWEEGPENWSMLAFNPGAISEELYYGARSVGATEEQARQLARVPDSAKCPAGVFAEPVNHWCLALCRED